VNTKIALYVLEYRKRIMRHKNQERLWTWEAKAPRKKNLLNIRNEDEKANLKA
jgi:hypothetical protein